VIACLYGELSKLALRHTGVVFYSKEVVVWFRADQKDADMPYRPISSHFQPWLQL